MDYRELKKLVRQGEGTHLEFKLKANHPEKIVREAVAFANTEGGLLLIGISDEKVIKGLKFADEDEYVLTQAFDKYCSPKIQYTIEKMTVRDEREILLFHIPQSNKLHYVIENFETGRRKVYIRVDDKSIQASREMREILRGKKHKRNIQFRYGDKERLLLQYLEHQSAITVQQFAKLANIPKRVASRTLVLLVLAKVLQVRPNMMEDSFVFREEVEFS